MPEKKAVVEAEPEAPTLKEQLEAEKREVAKLHDLRRKAKEEYEALEAKHRDLQSKVGDNNAIFSRLERELALGSTSPLDWDRGKKGDLVERVLNAFKTRDASDTSLKSAHDNLIRQHQSFLKQVEGEREGYRIVRDALEQNGLKSGASTPEIAAFINERLSTKAGEFKNFRVIDGPETVHAHVGGKGDIHIHLHIV